MHWFGLVASPLMPKVSVAANFACQPELLFELVRDWPGHARWQPTLAEATQDGPLQVGSRVGEVRAAFSQRVRSNFLIEEFEAGRKIVARSLDGPMNAEESYLVDPSPAGSRLTMAYDLEVPLMLRMFESHFTPQIGAELQRSLENLAALVEGGHPPHQAWVWQPT